MDSLAQERYRELATKLVALGIAEGPNGYHAYSLNKEVRDWMPTEQFVSDARVMAAVMRLVRNAGHVAWCRLTRRMCEEYVTHNMRLSITASCVELLEEL